MENRKRMIKTITAAELINGRTFDRTIIDIRPAEEYKKGSMDAALNIPEDKLVEYLENPEEADMESGTIGEGKAWDEGIRETRACMWRNFWTMPDLTPEAWKADTAPSCACPCP